MSIGCGDDLVVEAPATEPVTCSAVCQDPPAALCLSDVVVRRYESSCASESCRYESNDTACLEDERCAAATCALDPVIANDQGNPSAIAVDSTHIYWTNNDGQVMRRTKAGGIPEEFAPDEPYAFRIALDDTHVYWSQFHSGQLRYRAKSGGEVQTAVASTVYDVATDVTHVYFTDFSVGGVPGGVRRWDKQKGTIETLYQATDGERECPIGIALDADHVYWTDFDADVVRRVAKVGGAIETLYANPEPRMFGNTLVVDDTTVYWLNTRGDELRAIPKTGGAPTPIGTAMAGQLALDDSHLYWTTATGLVRRARGGTEIEPLATEIFGYSAAVTVDEGHVYWTEMSPDAGKVQRMRKPTESQSLADL
jgi:hypothetical protein